MHRRVVLIAFQGIMGVLILANSISIGLEAEMTVDLVEPITKIEDRIFWYVNNSTNRGQQSK